MTDDRTETPSTPPASPGNGIGDTKELQFPTDELPDELEFQIIYNRKTHSLSLSGPQDPILTIWVLEACKYRVLGMSMEVPQEPLIKPARRMPTPPPRRG